MELADDAALQCTSTAGQLPDVGNVQPQPGGTPVNPAAKYIVDLFVGKDASPAPNFDMPSVVATVGLVSDCAMGVQRSFDGGPLSFYTPPTS